MTEHSNPRRHRHPRLRRVGHILGLIYIFVTLLFGPIQALARWLGRQQLIQRYQQWVARFPPAIGLSVSLLSLSLLEFSKIAVLLSYHRFGVWAAIIVTFCAKASLGYFAHLTWHAARPKVIATYPWAARVDAWVGAQLAQLRGFRTQWVGYLNSRSWYPGAIHTITLLRKRAVDWANQIKRRLATHFS